MSKCVASAEFKMQSATFGRLVGAWKEPGPKGRFRRAGSWVISRDAVVRSGDFSGGLDSDDT